MAPARSLDPRSALVEKPAGDPALCPRPQPSRSEASKKTLLVTRFDRAVQTEDQSGGKVDKPLASASSISVRFMMTGTPSRKCSPIVRASL